MEHLAPSTKEQEQQPEAPAKENQQSNAGAGGAPPPAQPPAVPPPPFNLTASGPPGMGGSQGGAQGKGGLGPAREKMESAFDTDFSQVNVHENSQDATEMGALAFTKGNDIHFAPGQFNPGTSSGQELIGHELTHVVQQRNNKVAPTTQAKNGQAVNDDKGLESEADRMGAKAARGEKTGMNGASASAGTQIAQKKDKKTPTSTSSGGIVPPIIIAGIQLAIDLSGVDESTTIDVNQTLFQGVTAKSIDLVIEEGAFVSGTLHIEAAVLSGVDLDLTVNADGTVSADLHVEADILGFPATANAQVTEEGIVGNIEVVVPAGHQIIAGLKTTGGNLYYNFGEGISMLTGEVGVATDDGLATGSAQVRVNFNNGEWGGEAQLQSGPTNINIASGVDIHLPDGYTFSAKFGKKVGLQMQGSATVVPQVTLQTPEGIEAAGTAELEVRLGDAGLEVDLNTVKLAVTGGLNMPDMDEVLAGTHLTAEVDSGAMMTLSFTDNILNRVDLDVTAGLDTETRRVGRLSFTGLAELHPFSFMGMLHAVTNAAFTIVEGNQYSTSVMAGSQFFISVDQQGISNVDASLGLEVADQQSALAQLRVASSMPRGQGLSLAAKLELMRRINLTTVEEHGYGVSLLPSAELGATLQDGALTGIDGTLPLEVADQQGDLLAGSLEGQIRVSDETNGLTLQNGAASASLMRDLTMELAAGEVRVVEGTSIQVRFENGKLVSLGGEINALYNDGTRELNISASIDYDPNEKILRSLDASLSLDEVFSLFDGQLQVSELQGAIAIRNDELVSLGGSARLDAQVGDFELAGEAELTWTKEGDETAFVGAGWLEFDWSAEDNEDRFLNGRIDATIDGKEFTLMGNVQMGLLPGLTGEASIQMDQEMDPLISASLTYSTVVMEASELWAMEFEMGVYIPLIPGLAVEAGVLFGAGIDTRPLMVFGTVGVENWRPKSNEFPDFFAQLSASWGLDVEAQAMAFLQITLGIPGVLEGAGGIRAGVGLNIPIEINPAISLHGGSEGIWGEMGLDLSIAPILKLLIEAYVNWNALGIWEGEKVWNLVDQELANMGNIDWSGSFAFGDKQEPTGEVEGVQKQTVAPTGTPVPTPEGLGEGSSLGFGNNEQEPDSPVGLTGLTDGLSVPTQEDAENDVDGEGLGSELEKVAKYAKGISAVGDLIKIIVDGFKALIKGGPIGLIVWFLFKKPSKQEIQEKRDQVQEFKDGLEGDEVIAPGSPIFLMLGILSGEYSFWVIFDKSKPFRDLVDERMHEEATLEDRAGILEGLIKGWTDERDESRIITVLEYTLSNEGTGGIREMVEQVGGPKRIRDQYESAFGQDRNDRRDLDRIFSAAYGSDWEDNPDVSDRPTYTAVEGATVKRTGRSWDTLAQEAYGHTSYAVYLRRFPFNASQISQEEAYQQWLADQANNNNNNTGGGGPPELIEDDIDNANWTNPNPGPGYPAYTAYIPTMEEIESFHNSGIWQERFIVPGTIEYTHRFETYQMIARLAYEDENYDDALIAANPSVPEIGEGKQVVLPSKDELGPPWIEVEPLAIGSTGKTVWVSPDSNKNPVMWLGSPDQKVKDLAQDTLQYEEGKAAAEQLLQAATFTSETTQVDAENAVTIAKGLIDFIIASNFGNVETGGGDTSWQGASPGDTVTLKADELEQAAEAIYGHPERAAWITAYNLANPSGGGGSSAKKSAASTTTTMVEISPGSGINGSKSYKLPTWSEMNALDPLPAAARGIAPKSVIETLDGDTWSTLAQKAYGDWDLALKLAELPANASLSLAPGTSITLPARSELNTAVAAAQAPMAVDRGGLSDGINIANNPRGGENETTSDEEVDNRVYTPGGSLTVRAGDTWSAIATATYGDFSLFVKLANHASNVPYKTLPDGAIIYLPTLAELEDVAEFGLGLAPTGNPLLTEMVRIPTDDELHHVWAENQAPEGMDPFPVWMMASTPEPINQLTPRWSAQFEGNQEMQGKIQKVAEIHNEEVTGEAAVKRKTELQDIQNALHDTQNESGGGDMCIRAFVRHYNGIRLHTEPIPGDAYKTGDVYAAGTEVTITKSNSFGWSYIETPDCSGWVATAELRVVPENGEADVLTKEFYVIQQGDTLEKVIANKYPDYDITTGNDLRTIGEALVKLNLESGVTQSLYFEEDDQSYFQDLMNTITDFADPGFEYTRELWRSAKLRVPGGGRGDIIRLPSEIYINMLREQGEVGSRPEWMNTAIKSGKVLAGFLAGLPVGFIEAGIDMVTGIWDLLKGIFTGSLFSAIWSFIEKLGEEGIDVIWSMISDIYNGAKQSLIDAWNNPDAFEKGMFFGKIVGTIVFEIALAFFTAGAGTAIKSIPKVAKLIDRIPKFGKVADDVAEKLAPERDGAGKNIVAGIARNKGSKMAEDMGFGPIPADGYVWVRTPEGSLSMRKKPKGSPPKELELVRDANGNIEYEIYTDSAGNQKKRPKTQEPAKGKVSADMSELETMDEGDLNDLLQGNALSAAKKAELQDLMDQRDAHLAARKAAKSEADAAAAQFGKNSPEHNAALANMRNASRDMGELAGAMYMKSKGGTKLFPDGPVGGSAKSGEFDQIWQVGNDIYIVEAKGGSATRTTRTIGNKKYEQGTREYMEDILNIMESKDELADLASDMRFADTQKRLKYIQVKQKVTSSGELGKIEVHQFNI